MQLQYIAVLRSIRGEPHEIVCRNPRSIQPCAMRPGRLRYWLTHLLGRLVCNERLSLLLVMNPPNFHGRSLLFLTLEELRKTNKSILKTETKKIGHTSLNTSVRIFASAIRSPTTSCLLRYPIPVSNASLISFQLPLD